MRIWEANIKMGKYMQSVQFRLASPGFAFKNGASAPEMSEANE
jgi:hypothetical protein